MMIPKNNILTNPITYDPDLIPYIKKLKNETPLRCMKETKSIGYLYAFMGISLLTTIIFLLLSLITAAYPGSFFVIILVLGIIQFFGSITIISVAYFVPLLKNRKAIYLYKNAVMVTENKSKTITNIFVKERISTHNIQTKRKTLLGVNISWLISITIDGYFLGTFDSENDLWEIFEESLNHSS